MDNASIMIHVRFAPNGTVTEIGERPAELGPQDWFNMLSRNTTNCYQALSGGRGLFRISQEQLGSMKASVAPQGVA